MKLRERWGRHFHVGFDVSQSALETCELTATFEHKSLEAILQIIDSTLDIDIVRKDKEIILQGSCTLSLRFAPNMIRRSVSLVWLFFLGAFAWTCINAQVSDPRVTLDVVSAPLSQVLDEIALQTGMHSAYNPQEVDLQELVSYSCRNEPVSEVLDRLCGEVYIQYAIVEGQIVLTPMDPAQLPVFMVTGYVMDSTSGENLLMRQQLLQMMAYTGPLQTSLATMHCPLHRGKHTIILFLPGVQAGFY